jgi:hypothetical protein
MAGMPPCAFPIAADPSRLHSVVRQLRRHMIKPQDLQIQVGRAVGGDFMTVVHKPTGIRRGAGPPLPKPGKAQLEMIREIEAELVQKGLTRYLLPGRRSNGRGQNRT